jgi:hypothetical protein
LLEEKLERKFKDDMKERILPHIQHTDNVPAMVRFKMKATMKIPKDNQEIGKFIHVEWK